MLSLLANWSSCMNKEQNKILIISTVYPKLMEKEDLPEWNLVTLSSQGSCWRRLKDMLWKREYFKNKALIIKKRQAEVNLVKLSSILVSFSKKFILKGYLINLKLLLNREILKKLKATLKKVYYLKKSKKDGKNSYLVEMPSILQLIIPKDKRWYKEYLKTAERNRFNLSFSLIKSCSWAQSWIANLPRGYNMNLEASSLIHYAVAVVKSSIISDLIIHKYKKKSVLINRSFCQSFHLQFFTNRQVRLTNFRHFLKFFEV